MIVKNHKHLTLLFNTAYIVNKRNHFKMTNGIDGTINSFNFGSFSLNIFLKFSLEKRLAKLKKLLVLSIPIGHFILDWTAISWHLWKQVGAIAYPMYSASVTFL